MDAEDRYASLHERYFKRVLAYCVRRASDNDAYDAAAEVFTVAWRRIADVPEGEAALPWLYTVARNQLAHQRRSFARWERLKARLQREQVTSSPAAERIVLMRHELRRALDAVMHLRPADREILTLAAWEGLPHSDVATMLGITTSAVDQRLHRAKKRLAKAYDALEDREHTQPPSSAAEGGAV